MLRREKIIESVDSPGSHTLEFLGDEWDAALLGVAECGAPGMCVRPCYGYQALKAIMRELNTEPTVMYARLQHLVNKQMGCMRTPPLLLTRLSRRELWRSIGSFKFPRWEQLDRGIIGVGRVGWDTAGIVYNKPLCVSILISNQSSPTSNELQEAGQVATMMDTSIVPVYLGEYSPWYLTPVI